MNEDTLKAAEILQNKDFPVLVKFQKIAEELAKKSTQSAEKHDV